METLQNDGTLATYEGKKDPLKRNATGIQVEIDCAMAGQTCPGGHLLARGKQVVTILAEDLPAVMGMRREPWEAKAITEAIESFELAINHDVAERGDHQWTAQEVAAQAALKPSEVDDLPPPERERYDEIMKLRKLALTETGGSPEAEFFRKHGRGFNPILSVEVLNERVDLKEDEFRDRRDEALLGNLVDRLLANREAAGDATAAAQFQAQLDMQRESFEKALADQRESFEAQIEELKKSSKAKPKG